MAKGSKALLWQPEALENWDFFKYSGRLLIRKKVLA
jgi:hypothetical protein